MGELLLELLSEEIPARMQRRAIDDLTGLIRDKLAAADIPAEKLTGTVTPRRLTVIADDIPARQPDREEERRGPRVGAPEQAIAGFLRAAGLTSIDQCETRGGFHFAVIRRPGRATTEVLPELIHAAMTALPWPKSMRYPASGLRWVRPLNSVVCLFDGEVLERFSDFLDAHVEAAFADAAGRDKQVCRISHCTSATVHSGANICTMPTLSRGQLILWMPLSARPSTMIRNGTSSSTQSARFRCRSRFRRQTATP